MTPRAANAGVVSRSPEEATAVMIVSESPEIDNLKQCSRCKAKKPATTEYFRVRKDSKDGLRGECITCYSEIRRKRANRPELKRAKREYDRQRALANPEKKRELRKKQYQTRIDKERDAVRRWQQANPERCREINRRWYRANPDTVKARDNRRRARELQAEGTHTAEDIQAQYNSQRGKCWWCGKKVGETYHVDHRIPLSRGGSNAPENLVIACPKCNLSKNDKLPHEWGDRLL